MSEDIALTIMNERIEAGIQMVKDLAGKYKIPLSEAVFIKGIEVGISLFIQKETARRVSGFQKPKV